MTVTDTIRVFTTLYPDLGSKVKNERHVEFVVGKEKIRDVVNFVYATYPDVLPETVFGVDLGDENYEVNYMFWTRGSGVIIQLRVNLTGPEPSIDTTCDIFPAFEWQERETQEMFGITFLNHPDPRPLLLPDELVGKYPLRKSFQTDRSRLAEADIPAPKIPLSVSKDSDDGGAD